MTDSAGRYAPYKVLITTCLIGQFALCNTHSALADPAPEINACTLLTSGEISQVTGFPVDNGVRMDQGLQADGSYSSTCFWVIQQGEAAAHNSSAPLGGRSFVILNAMQWPADSDKAASFLQSFRDAAANGVISSTPVPRRFGDEALWWGDGLAVRKGDTSFGVSVVLPEQKSKRPIAFFEETLAPYILGRLVKRTID